MDIYEFSKRVGYSPSTISKALNNYRNVNANTRKKIVDAAIEMGYSPSVTAKAFRTKKSWQIGFFFMEGLDNYHPHFSAILCAFGKCVEERGYDLLRISDSFSNKKYSFVEHCLRRSVEGIIIAHDKNDAHQLIQAQIKRLKEHNIKIISVNEIYDGVCTVISNSLEGAKTAMGYLYSLGHRKIAYINAPAFAIGGRHRFEGYKEFMEEKGLAINERYITTADNYTYKAGYSSASRLMSDCWGDMPTALFAPYDELAAGAMEALKENGFSIPGDISVIGFDDLPLAMYQTPGLTTVLQEREQIGIVAAERILSEIEGGAESSGVVYLPTRLVIRKSCRRINLLE